MAFDPLPPPNALTIAETAQLAGVVRVTVERWLRLGKLPFSRYGKRRFIDRDDLDRFLRTRR